jgi:hypothetical protein
MRPYAIASISQADFARGNALVVVATHAATSVTAKSCLRSPIDRGDERMRPIWSGVMSFKQASSQAANKQLQRTVIRRRGDGASAPFHYALAPRFTRHRAAAELRR